MLKLFFFNIGNRGWTTLSSQYDPQYKQKNKKKTKDMKLSLQKVII